MTAGASSSASSLPAAVPGSVVGGERIGRFELLGTIGSGATCIVYRAIDTVTGSEVALKVLADNHSLSADRRSRFLDESEMMAAVDSPGVISLFGSGETSDGRLYMALQLAERGDLRTRVEAIAATRGQLGRQDVIVLARQLTEGIAAVHAAGFVHRDVAPGNLLITTGSGAGRGAPGAAASPPMPSTTTRGLLEPGERFVLGDLGLAKDLLFASGLTAGVGTRGFAAPEQVEEVTVVDTRADVYGATALVEWVVERAAPALSDQLQSFIARGKDHDPDGRPTSIETWLDEIERCLANRPAPPTSRWRRVGLAGVAVVVAAVAAVVVPGSLSDETVQGSGPAVGADADPPSTEANGTTGSAVAPPQPAQSTGSAATTTVGTDTTAPSDSLPTSGTVILLEDVPRAFVEQPLAEAPIVGGLTITGSAVDSVSGVSHIEMAVKNTDTNRFWHDATQTMETTWVRFRVPVTPSGGTAVEWTYTLPAEQLTPGRYRIRVWARAVAGNGDPVSDTRFVNVSD